MALPSEVTPRTKAEWTKLADSNDKMDRKVISEAMRALGYQPTEYLRILPAARVDIIMKAQGEEPTEAKEEPKEEKKKKANTAAASPAATGGGLSAEDRAKLDKTYDLLAKVHNMLCVVILSDERMADGAGELGIEVELLKA